MFKDNAVPKYHSPSFAIVSILRSMIHLSNKNWHWILLLTKLQILFGSPQFFH